MLVSFLSQNQIRYETDVSLRDLTTFRVGGVAEIVIYPDSTQKVADLVAFLKQNNIDYFVMGNGSNLLFSDERFVRPILKTDDLLTMSVHKDEFTFGAGVKMAKAANFAAEHCYSGMEFAHGIPGSIGGAVYMNAGAYDGTMSQIVCRTTYVDEDGNIDEIVGDAHDFQYRHSFFSHKNLIITETLVKLVAGDETAIREKMADFMQRRKDKQPLNLPSAGSTFKRPVGAFAGKLIQDCGLMGFQIGGAAVSTKHAGFVVNVDHASFSDVRNVISHVQETVKKETGFFLECEVEIVE